MAAEPTHPMLCHHLSTNKKNPKTVPFTTFCGTMKLLFFPAILFVFDGLIVITNGQMISQQELLGVPQTSDRSQYICGSDPFRFYSEFPCNMYPVCLNGGFKLNVGCVADYQCTPYARNAVCVNSCCCTVPRIIGPETTTRRFFDNAGTVFGSSTIILIFSSLLFVIL